MRRVLMFDGKREDPKQETIDDIARLLPRFNSLGPQTQDAVIRKCCGEWIPGSMPESVPLCILDVNSAVDMNYLFRLEGYKHGTMVSDFKWLRKRMDEAWFRFILVTRGTLGWRGENPGGPCIKVIREYDSVLACIKSVLGAGA